MAIVQNAVPAAMIIDPCRQSSPSERRSAAAREGRSWRLALLVTSANSVIIRADQRVPPTCVCVCL